VSFHNVSLLDGHPRTLGQATREPATKSDVLETSSVFVAASFIGRESQNLALIKMSLSLYTRGLRQLQRALHDPRLMREDETLAACMALNIYEAVECPGSETGAYFNHCHGITALRQARGAHAHVSGAGRLLFLGARIPEIMRALRCRTSTVLSDKIWVTQPWSLIPKSFYDQVTDCLAEAPGILKRVLPLWHLSFTQQLELVHECRQIDERLAFVHDEMQRTSPDRLYWSIPSQGTSAWILDSPGNFPVIYWFVDLHCAATLTLL
ncbi:hypothetical protein N7523_009766, partial [Penicillium sp. IBT 18751x]